MSGDVFEYEEKRTATAQIFRDLAIEMFELTALDLSRAQPDPLDRTQAAVANRENRRSALLWLSDEGEHAAVPFALCCDALNAPVEATRAAIMADPRRVLQQIRGAMAQTSGIGDRAQGDEALDETSEKVSRRASPRA